MRTISLTATASGGTTPYTFDPLSISPSELTLGISTQPSNDGDRTISGTATPAGEYNVEVTVEDAPDSTATCSFEITVCEPVVIADIPPITVTAEARFSHTATVSGGCGTRTSSREDGPTWVGTEIDTNGNLMISGTAPSTPGRHDVRVRVQAEGENSDTEPFTITVVPPLDCDPIVIDPISNVTVTVGDNISITTRVTGGCPPIVFSKPDEPSWVTIGTYVNEILTINVDAPNTPGTHEVRVTATDNRNNTDDEDFTIKVECPPITVTQNPDPVVVPAGETATVTVSAEGGCGTKTFGNPGGLGWVRKTGSNEYTVEPPSGTAPGPYTFGVTATDAEGNTGPGSIKVTVECPDISVSGLAITWRWRCDAELYLR